MTTPSPFHHRGLEAELVELGRSLVWPATPPLAERMVAPRPGIRRRLVLVASAAVAVVLLAAGVPDVRRAIADILGLGGVEIRHVADLPTVSSLPTPLGRAVDLDEAERAVGFPIGLPAAAGRPDEVYVSQGRVTLVYRSEADFKMTITEFPTPVDATILLKEVSPAARVEVVRREGRVWYWIEGPHTVLVLDGEGNPIPDTARLAGNTLVWVQDGITYRLESGLERDEAIDLAETVRS